MAFTDAGGNGEQLWMDLQDGVGLRIDIYPRDH